jgi:thiol-disulfide isomerase/thioredoxin
MKKILIIIGVIVLLAIGVVVYIVPNEKKSAEPEQQNESLEVSNNQDFQLEATIEGVQKEYIGTILAGDKALLLDFNLQDYQKALSSDKLVILYFYANWCPICRAEFPKMQDAFNSTTRDDVIGFRVNYNDNETDANETALAREFGIAYQHTKIFIKNGQRLLKSPETWDKNRYIEEVNKY